ncbi:hypothetical protein HZA39_02510, partial [Candidatus Peregrinibacteria bacterium]|nr:hypothetical protein [Candidatus Peregrinibacteria bacterium]
MKNLALKLLARFIKRLAARRTIIVFLLACVFFTQILGAPAVYAFSVYPKVEAGGTKAEMETPERSSLVVILADKNLLEDGANYEGLSGSYGEVSSATIAERVERYAKDVAGALPKTKVKIIRVDSEDKEAARKITEVLDKLYFEGEEVEGTISQLRGVVLIGRVPLPVVGMFPYTDFEDKYYIYNYSTGEFEVNKNSGIKKAEVWHGIIKGSASDENTARQQIAVYLDKNHLYHTGNKDFTDFEKKILVADLDQEAKSMTRPMFANYLENLASMEDLAYFRYTKEWLSLLMKKFGQIAADAIDFDAMGKSPPDGMKNTKIEMPDGSKQNLSDMISGAANSVKTALKNPDGQKLNMPDIYTKFLIEQFLKPYVLLFEKHLSEVNDWVSGTGRWDTKSVDTMPSLITKRDLWAREYLKIVNNSIEKKIDGIIAKIQKPIPLIRYVEVSGGTSLKNEGNKNITQTSVKNIIGFSGEDNKQFGFSSSKNLIFLNNGFDMSMNKSGWKSYVNGVDYANLNSVSECSVYRGSAKVAQMLRTGNIETINSNSYPAEKKPPDPKKIPSLGVNVKPAESLIVKILTLGQYENGYIVAGDSYTGMPAVFPDDRNGISKILAAGDILLEVDTKKLTPDYSLQDALKIYHPNIFTQKTINNILYTTWPEPTVVYYDQSDGKIKSKKIGIVDGNTGYFRKSGDTTYDDPSNGEDESTGFVNCFALNLKNPERCFADFASMPVFDASASYEADENDPNIKYSVSPRACYNFNIYETPTPINGGPRDGMYRYFKDVKLGYSWVLEGSYENSVFGVTQAGRDSYLDDLYDGGDPNKMPLPKKPTRNLGGIPLVPSGDFTLADFLRIFSDAYSKNYDYNWDKFQKEFLEIDQEKTYLFRMREWGEITDEIKNKPAELQNKIKKDYEAGKNLKQYGIKVFVAEDNPIAADVLVTFKPHLYKIDGETKYIPSTVFHKQPDNYILEAQSISPMADALPVDKPRYVSFINKLNGKETRVDYPNIFKVNSYDDWISSLKKKEMELYGLSAENYEGSLTSIFQKDAEAYAAASGKQDGVMTIVDENKAKDAVEWKNLGIDEKHAKLLLDHNRGAKPYEAMYLNAKGGSDFINMNFNGDAPSHDEDTEYNGEYNDLISKKEFEPDSKNPAVQDKLAVKVKEAEQSGYSYKYKYMGQDAVPLDKWLQAIKQWAENLGKQYSRAFSFSDSDENKGSADKFYDIEEPGKNTVALKLSAVDGKTTLQANAGDTASFRIEAVDKSGAIDKTDNATSVEFKIIGSGIESTISGASTQYLANGYVIFQIISGEKIEDFSVMAIGTKPASSGNVYSNVLQINTVKKRLVVTPPQTILKAGSGQKFLIKVNVLNEKDEIDSADNKTLVTIKTENDSNKYIKLLSNTAKVSSGTAEFKAETTDKAGLVELSVSAGFIAPAKQTNFSVYPADPVKIDLKALPNVIKTNGSRGKIKAVLLDANGNVAEGASNVFKFNISGPAKLLTSEVMSFTGEAEVEFESENEAGKIDVNVSVETENAALVSSVSIQSMSDISLFIEASATEIKANAESKALITVKAADSAGNIIQNYYSPILFSASQKTFGHFTDKVSVNIENGIAGAEFMSSVIAGTTTIKIDAPGFETKTIDIKTVPLEPYQITLTSDKKSMISDGKDSVALSVNFFDKNMNRILEGEYNAHLRITKSTQAYGKFEGENPAETDIKFINGFANIKLLSTLQSGPVHIVAETSAIKVPDGDADKTRNKSGLEIFSAKRFFATDFKNAGATPLYATVVGEKFGDTKSANYLAAELLFNGKTQAVMSMMNDFSAPNGFGFKDQNKHLLLLASGLSVGEATLPYIPESAIVLGDPTVKLIGANESSVLGYTKDIGQQIFTGDDAPKSIIPIDYDNNGAIDLFAAYSNGKIRLLENVGGSEKFRDRGVFLDVVNGINAVIAADIDNNAATDLIVATTRGCKKNEVCVDIYWGQAPMGSDPNGFFIRENFPLKISKQAYMLAAEDFNKDGFKDLALSDSVGDVSIFYNNNGTINPIGQKLGSLGVNIDPNQNLADSVLFFHTGAKINEAANAEKDKPPHKDYETLSVPTNTAVPDEYSGFYSMFGGPQGQAKKETQFVINNSDNAAVSNLTIEKHAEAKTGSLDIGDTVKYTIKVRAKNAVNNLWISDYVPGVIDIDKNSIALDGKACNGSFKCVETGVETTPYALGGVNLWPGQELIITYSATVKFLPKIVITAIKNSDKVPVQDDIPDILANIEGNESGQVVYFYSTAAPGKDGKTPFAEFTYVEKKAAAPTDPANFYADADQNSVEVNAEMSKYYKDILEKSFSFDNMLDNVAKKVEDMVSSLRCSGGCLAMPINHAFLVPGLNNNFGIPTTFQDGLPVFATGCPSLIPIWPPTDYHSSTGFRFYISPTLTGRVAFGFCGGGPYLTGTCYAFAPPIGIPQSACDAVNKGVGDALSNVSGIMQSPGSDNFTLIAGGGQPTAEPSSGFQASKYFGNYPVKTYASTNITVPGFPAVIANWFDKQVEEILNKLGDGPDIYIIHPKWSNLLGSELVVPKEKLTGFTELLSYINSIPLVQIEGKDVAVKVPTITPREIEKVINDYRQFRRDFNYEIKKIKAMFKCTDENKPDYDPMYDPTYNPNDPYDVPYVDPTNSTEICKKLKVSAGAFANSIEKNITALEEWKMFPKKIIEWRNIEAKYSRQIINYLTIISDYLGGYMNRQQKRINAWLDAVLKIKSIIEKWKVFLDIMLDYQTSCDSCKSDRFSLLELLFRIFIVVPEPPIVPFPKWPDLVLDFSQIQAGVKIIWPDFVFVPEPLIIPRLPRISLPIVLPDVFIDFEPLPIIPSPPPLSDLPNLPSLPLVRLPDLPPAPIIPDILAFDGLKTAIDTLRKALKILCLIKKGLVEVPETALKTEIEALTQRSLNPPLSIDLAGGIKTPPIIPGGPYSLLDKITATVKINAQVETDVVYKAAEKAAEKFNKIVTGVMKVFNTELYKLQKVVEGATTLPGKIEMKDIDVKIKTKSLINYNDESYTSRLKKAIIDYQKDQGNLTSHLLANNITNFEPASIKRYVASVNGPDLSGGGSSNPLPATMTKYADQMQTQGKPTGLFIVNSKLGVADKLIDYTEETKVGTQIAYLDQDNDGDQDIVFNLGGDLFIKENHIAAAESEKHFTDIDSAELDELLPNAISINNFASDYANGSAAFRW